MAQIVIKTSIEKANVTALLHQVCAICKTDENLSPRPLKELKNAYANSNLFIALDGSLIVGWLLRIPYNQMFQELAAGYVIEEHRPKGVFNIMLEKAVSCSPISTIVTFNNSFAHYLLYKGFKKSSLWEVIKLSQGKFLLNRLHIVRLKAIKKHYNKNKPIYVIYKRK